MGILERIRSGLRSIASRIRGFIGRSDVPKDVQRVSLSVIEDVRKLEKEIRGIQGTPIRQEQIYVREPEYVREREDYRPSFRFLVSIQYRAIGSPRDYTTISKSVEAESPEEAIALVEEELPSEPDYILTASAKREEG